VLKLGIIGYPLEHSLSPHLHRLFFDEIGVHGEYRLFECRADELADLLAELRRTSVTGFNVTIPHKETILPHLDEVAPEAQFIGAVNTVRITEDGLSGFNTDCIGFQEALLRHGCALGGKTAVVIGAGGAARAVCYQLASDHVRELIILNRTPERAETLSRSISRGFPRCGVRFAGLQDSHASDAIRTAGFIVNTTSCGMWPKVQDVPVELTGDLAGKTVMDVVYNPLATQFLRQAQVCGAEIIDGLDMLIYQGAAALQRWLNTSKSITFDYMKVREYLKGRMPL